MFIYAKLYKNFPSDLELFADKMQQMCILCDNLDLETSPKQPYKE